jgi:ubiquinone/menaquinone biosynthesis C-methylase UbiE
MDNQQASQPIYVLGHEEEELQRLIEQSRLFGDLTEQVFLKAGIQPGMRVLDLGCGAGDVSFLAAKLVGPSGKVIGVDQSAESIAMARNRAEAAKLQRVTFMQSNLTELSLDEPVDAVVGRFILMYLPDPASLLRSITRYVRPGGILAFQEMDFSHFPTSMPALNLYTKIGWWMQETFRRGNAEVRMGLKLKQTFLQADLPTPQMILSALVEGRDDSAVYPFIVQTIRSLLPRMESLGVATAQEVEIDTLTQRLREEVVSHNAVIVSPYLVGAWARKE